MERIEVMPCQRKRSNEILEQRKEKSLEKS
jgi:hypothetical protein